MCLKPYIVNYGDGQNARAHAHDFRMIEMYEEKKRRNRCTVFLCLYFFFLLSGEAKA